MEKVMETASDIHVRGEKFYVKDTPDGYCYEDSACTGTKKLSKANLINAFNMGTAIIVDNDIEYRPISISVTGTGENEHATLTYVKTDGTTATTAVLATVVSSEYTSLG